MSREPRGEIIQGARSAAEQAEDGEVQSFGFYRPLRHTPCTEVKRDATSPSDKGGVSSTHNSLRRMGTSGGASMPSFTDP